MLPNLLKHSSYCNRMYNFLFSVTYLSNISGLIKSLHGLNISNNPLDFPPQSIIEKGTNEILKFLREMIEAKSSGKLLNGSE